MAASPQWKVYTPQGEYVASAKHTEGASLLMSLYGDGSTIRFDHRKIVWTEGIDGNASQSYDYTAEQIHKKLHGNLLLKTGESDE
jgi:hypothetical protein